MQNQTASHPQRQFQAKFVPSPCFAPRHTSRHEQIGEKHLSIARHHDLSALAETRTAMRHQRFRHELQPAIPLDFESLAACRRAGFHLKHPRRARTRHQHGRSRTYGHH